MITILIAEDIRTNYEILRNMFDEQPDLKVIGWAKNGREAVELADSLCPDIITMDIDMDEMDGLEATRVIMSSKPIPIVVVSIHAQDADRTIPLRALEEGSLAVLEKPGIGDDPADVRRRRTLLETVRAMAGVKLVKRKHASVISSVTPAAGERPYTGPYRVVALGCSAGGPQVLNRILQSLPADFPLPILVTQHIITGFTPEMVKWLGGHANLRVKLAEEGETVTPGNVYIAPCDRHLIPTRHGERVTIRLSDRDSHEGFKPSISEMMEAVANCYGREAIGALLTGMGRDGAAGLLQLFRAGGHTFVQGKESALIHSMPQAALALGAAQLCVNTDKIAEHLLGLVTR